MTPSDIDRVQTYLRRLFGTERLKVVPPPKKGLTVEVSIDDEVIGTLHRDEEEGEVSYSMNVIILEEDLPPVPKTPARAAARR